MSNHLTNRILGALPIWAQNGPTASLEDLYNKLPNYEQQTIKDVLHSDHRVETVTVGSLTTYRLAQCAKISQGI
jgi:hypothetical protein